MRSSPAADVFQIDFFCLIIHLFLFACHAVVVVVTGFVLNRLFASVATFTLKVGTSRSAVKHHRFFLEYYTAVLSYLGSDRK